MLLNIKKIFHIDPEADVEEWLTTNCDILRTSNMYLSRVPTQAPYLKDDSDEELSADESDNYSDTSEETKETSVPSENQVSSSEETPQQQLSSKERAKHKLAMAAAKKAKNNNNDEEDIEELGKSMSAMKTVTQEQRTREKQANEAESQAKMPVGDQQLTSKAAPKEVEIIFFFFLFTYTFIN